MKRVLVKSIFDAFDYAMQHYYPAEMEELVERSDSYAVISIQDTHTKGFGITFSESQFCKAVLTLYFDDIMRPVEQAALFTEEMAQQIITFIQANRSVDTLLIHCYAGQSRSRAVGAFAVKMLGGDNSAYFSKHSPNMYVYQVLTEQYARMQQRKSHTDRKILITNDDGITSDGLLRLAKAASKFGKVWVVAPDSQRSAMSHSITLHKSFDLLPCTFPVEGVRAYQTNGTPADCVRVGILNLVEGKPDYVFSGINFGYNSATDLQYSATAGAAFEGAFQGIPSIAFSEGTGACHEVTDAYLEKVIEELLKRDPGPGQIWNVNFPDCPLSECQGILRDRKVSRDSFYHDAYREEKLPDGSLRMQVNGIYNEICETGTDMRAIIEKYISIGAVHNLQ